MRKKAAVKSVEKAREKSGTLKGSAKRQVLRGREGAKCFVRLFVWHNSIFDLPTHNTAQK
jgi:hypothetical protein